MVRAEGVDPEHNTVAEVIILERVEEPLMEENTPAAPETTTPDAIVPAETPAPEAPAPAALDSVLLAELESFPEEERGELIAELAATLRAKKAARKTKPDPDQAEDNAQDNADNLSEEEMAALSEEDRKAYPTMSKEDRAKIKIKMKAAMDADGDRAAQAILTRMISSLPEFSRVQGLSDQVSALSVLITPELERLGALSGTVTTLGETMTALSERIERMERQPARERAVIFPEAMPAAALERRIGPGGAAVSDPIADGIKTRQDRIAELIKTLPQEPSGALRQQGVEEIQRLKMELASQGVAA